MLSNSTHFKSMFWRPPAESLAGTALLMATKVKYLQNRTSAAKKRLEKPYLTKCFPRQTLRKAFVGLVTDHSIRRFHQSSYWNEIMMNILHTILIRDMPRLGRRDSHLWSSYSKKDRIVYSKGPQPFSRLGICLIQHSTETSFFASNKPEL